MARSVDGCAVVCYVLARYERHGMDKIDEIEHIRKRQTARLLAHLEDTGQLTDRLRTDLLRSLGFMFEDVEKVVNTAWTGAESVPSNGVGGGKVER